MGEYRYITDINKLKIIEMEINNLMELISTQKVLMSQNMMLYNSNKDEKYLKKAQQNLTNMQSNVNNLNKYYTNLDDLSGSIIELNEFEDDINIVDILEKIKRENEIINNLENEYNNIEAELNFTGKTVKSNYYQYNIILSITLILLIMVCLSYFYDTNILYEYIILGLLIIYVLYFLYNLL